MLGHASELPDILFKKLVLYLRRALMNETLPPKTPNEKRLDRTYWVHNPEKIRHGPVIMLDHVRVDHVRMDDVRVDLLTEVRNATKKRVRSPD